MDAKSRANFINSVASGASIPCPKCGAANKPGSEHCATCGAAISSSQEAQNGSSPFEPSREAAPAKTVKYEEPNNVFAKGLPDWSIEPPQVMVRRH